MSTGSSSKQINFFIALGATEEEVKHIETLSTEDAKPLIGAKVQAKVKQLVAGIHLELYGEKGLIMSNFDSKGQINIRVQWDNGKTTVDSISHFFNASILSGFDEKVAARDKWEKRIFTVLWKYVTEEGIEPLPSFDDRTVSKRLLEKVEKAFGLDCTDEQIITVIVQFIESWRSRQKNRFRRIKDRRG